jgi:hypothetical protein
MVRAGVTVGAPPNEQVRKFVQDATDTLVTVPELPAPGLLYVFEAEHQFGTAEVAFPTMMKLFGPTFGIQVAGAVVKIGNEPVPPLDGGGPMLMNRIATV